MPSEAHPSFVALAEAVRFRPDKLTKCNLFTSDNMFCDVYCLLPGQSQPPHAHANSDKIYVVLAGQVRVLIGTEERVLGVGEAAYSAPGQQHGLVHHGTEPAQVLVFMTPKP